jgi:hypothetical protein
MIITKEGNDFVNEEGKKIGKIIGDTYVSHRTDVHFMRKYQGFGVSEFVLNILKKEQIKYVMIIYEGKEGVKRFKCPTEKFIASNKTFAFEGNDLQRFVSEKDMERILLSTFRVG